MSLSYIDKPHKLDDYEFYTSVEIKMPRVFVTTFCSTFANKILIHCQKKIKKPNRLLIKVN